MKLLKLAALVLTMCFMTTGCDTSSDSPESLLNDNIVYNKSKNELYTFVNQSLDGTTLLLPGNSSEVGEINELDSNVIAFQRKQDVNANKNEVGLVLISKNNDKYVLKDSYLEEGEDIEYANFYDLNNDGNDEIILLIKNGITTTMNVYSIIDDKIELLSTVVPTWLDNYIKYTNTKIKIGFIDDDLKLDVLMINHDYNSGNMYATILNYDKDNQIKNSNSVKFTNVKNINELYATIGRVHNSSKGAVLSIPTTKDGYITQILCMKDNKLTKVFDEGKEIFNSYYIPVSGKNSDGVISFPVLNNNMIENYSSANSKSSALVSWKKWNGKFNKDADTIFISQIYYNYKNNFKFLVPNNLANKLYIQKNILGDTLYYIFYYYDKNDKEPTELFQIGISSKNLVEDAKTTTNADIILTETDNNYYQLIVKNKKIFENYDLTLDNIKEYFSLIYQ